MAALSMGLRVVKVHQKINVLKKTNLVPNVTFFSTVPDEEDSKTKTTGFAESFKKHEELLQLSEKHSEPPVEDFHSLIRNSQFISLGNPVGKAVVGTIYRVVGDDLYIDFGWKFPTVCPKPMKNKEDYYPGVKVRLLIKDLELSSRFLGATKDITLLEADCILLGRVASH